MTCADGTNFDKRVPNGRASLNKTTHFDRKAGKITEKWRWVTKASKMSDTVTNVTAGTALSV